MLHSTLKPFGAKFAKVLVDPQLGIMKVENCVAVMDTGQVLNLKIAENQIIGEMISGTGMASVEHTACDANNGPAVTRNLAHYLVLLNADMPEFTVQFIDKPNVGARGMGETGITGITAAIVNAAYHATG